MTVGIICEYNPFHKGHLYHLNEIKKMYPSATIILIMSSNFTQRGELSIINKWDKTKIAIYYGVDLVVELPFKYATSSADIFAYGAINILKHLKVDKLVFGSESNDISYLNNLAQIALNNKDYDDLVKNYSKQGYNYPTATNKALEKLSNNSINTPNDLLGLSYIKQIIKQKANIGAITIKRTNDYHNKELNEYSSASAIRKALKQNINISKYLPDCVNQYINKIFIDDYFDYIKYKIISSNDLTIYNGVDNSIKNRLKRYVNASYTLEEYIQKLKTKRYTYNRLKRLLLHILVGYTKQDNSIEYNYIRILGFNKKGQSYLNKIKKELQIPLITNYSNSNNLLNLEDRVNNIIYLKQDKNLLQKEKEELIKY